MRPDPARDNDWVAGQHKPRRNRAGGAAKGIIWGSKRVSFGKCGDLRGWIYDGERVAGVNVRLSGRFFLITSPENVSRCKEALKPEAGFDPSK